MSPVKLRALVESFFWIEPKDADMIHENWVELTEAEKLALWEALKPLPWMRRQIKEALAEERKLYESID